MLQKVVPPAALPILETLQLFREVQTGCFGWDLCPDYKEKIEAFKESVKKLQVYFKVSNIFKIQLQTLQTVLKLKSATIPWKLHMVCAHLEETLTRLGQGLGMYCEQAGEAVHHKVKKTKARYVIENVLHDSVDGTITMYYFTGTRGTSTIPSTEQPKRSMWSTGRLGTFSH